MVKHLRDFFSSRSLSFRLYILIVPTTILAIYLLGYLDTRVSTHLLDQRVEENTKIVANNLAQELGNRPSVSRDGLLLWLRGLLDANYYIARIDVYQLSGNDVSRLQTTASSPSEPITVDELAAMRDGETKTSYEFLDRGERFVKVVVPFANSAVGKGCVSVTSALWLSERMREIHAQIALFLIPGTVLVLVILLHQLFTRGVTSRIGRLVHTMSEAKAGDLKKRAVVDSKDELGIIAERFNDMMEEIERGTKERDRLLDELKDFNAHLQVKVSEATQEISAANERLRQLNQDLVQTQRRLTQSERAAVVGQMAATFAHEIGSPLSAISTHLELLGETPSISREMKDRVQLVQEQVNRITGFVEELLSETRSSVQAQSAVQLNQLLDQLLMFLDQHLHKCRVSISTSFSPDLPEIEANPQQLQQVFLNLLNNACDAMPNGGTVRVATWLETRNGTTSAVVSVSDDGVGIPPEKQEHIFEPFFTTKDLRRGTGLGLSIAAKIIRLHKGTITLQSEPKRGTTFTIRFPVQPGIQAADKGSPAGG